jgi:hypothetical protein
MSAEQNMALARRFMEAKVTGDLSLRFKQGDSGSSR